MNVPRPLRLCFLLMLCVACSRAPTPGRGDVLLVILDTTRADHLSAYGYGRPTSPALERLAAEGELYEQAWSQSPWTLPAIATILTGQPPHVHGAGRTERGLFGLRAEVTTLAERLAAAGYATAAVINVLWCDPRLSSLDRGFGVYDFRTSDESNVGQRDAGATTDAALAWLDRIGAAPFFLVVHYFDPHLTYDPPAPWDTTFEDGEPGRVPSGFGSAREIFAVRDGSLPLDAAQRRSLVARYDGELRYVDEQIDRLRRGLEERGRWQETLVVVVGDHGEEFWDHGGFEHGHSHFRELLRVPLIVRRPAGAAGARHTGRVRQIDIAPTVLEFAGVAPSPELPGRLLDGSGADFAVAEGSLWAGRLISVRSDAGTLIRDRRSGEARFFTAADTLEREPLGVESPAARELERLAAGIPEPPDPTVPPVELDPQQIEILRSLGYLR